MSTLERFNVPRDLAGTPLVDIIARTLECSKKLAKRLLDERKVFVNQQRVWMAKHKVSAGDIIEVQAFEREELTSVKLTILYEDSDYLVLSKPAGVLSDGASSIEALARESRREAALRAVHRLDRDTTGCLLFARNEPARIKAMNEFTALRVKKDYLAIVLGRVSRPLGKVTKPIDGKSAITEFSILDTGAQATLIGATLHTGRTHQIRKHLAALGLHIAGDKQYGASRVANKGARALPRQMLHAWKLELPTLGIHAKAPPPEDFDDACRAYGLRWQ